MSGLAGQEVTGEILDERVAISFTARVFGGQVRHIEREGAKYGDGVGSGDGYGDCDCDGYGDCDCDGYGDCDCDGDGYGWIIEGVLAALGIP